MSRGIRRRHAPDARRTRGRTPSRPSSGAGCRERPALIIVPPAGPTARQRHASCSATARSTSRPRRRRDGPGRPLPDRGDRAPRRDRPRRGRRAPRGVAPRRGGLGRDVVGVEVPAERLAPALELAGRGRARPDVPGPARWSGSATSGSTTCSRRKADPARRAEEAFLATIYTARARRTAGPPAGLRDTVAGLDADVRRAAWRAGLDSERDRPSSSAATWPASTCRRSLERLLGDVARRPGARRPAADRRRDAGRLDRPVRPGGPSAGLRPVGAPGRPSSACPGGSPDFHARRR